MKGKHFAIIASVIVIALLGFLAVTIYTKSEDITAVEQQAKLEEEKLKKEGLEKAENTLVVGVDGNFVPITFTDANGKTVGFDADLAVAVVQQMGMEVSFKVIDWAKKDDELASGAIDLIWAGLTVTDERKGLYALSDIYATDAVVIVVNRSSTIYSKTDLGGKVAGIQAGGFVKESLEKYQDSEGVSIKEITEFPEASMALSGLITNEVDFVVMDKLQAGYYINNTPDTYRMMSYDDFGTREMAVAAKKGNTGLIKKINAALAKAKANGTIKRIESKWFASE